MDKTIGKYIETNLSDVITEWKVCEVTGEEFPIFQSEIDMLDKLSPIIDGEKYNFPIPSLSPKAREIKRLLFRNEFNFYKDKSNKSQKPIVSLYSDELGIKVYNSEEYFSDSWCGTDYGFEIDDDLSVNEHINILRGVVPRLNMVTVENGPNCEYTTGTGYCKNCYLINSSENSEDCYYGKLFQNCKNCCDCSYVYDSDRLYECLNVKNGHNCMFLNNSTDCYNCFYSDDLIGCENCMFSSNLRNKSYYFKNEKLTKDDYDNKIKDYLVSRDNLSKGKELFKKQISNRIHKYAMVTNSEKSFGDSLTDDKDCFSCYDVNRSEDCKYIGVGVEIKNCMDCNNLYIGPEKSYNVLGSLGTNNCHCSVFVFNSTNLLYCQDCYDCNNLFGCVGLRNKEYCIYNKQYTKEEYIIKVQELIKSMIETQKWGDFIDISISSFPYNDSLAMEYHPIKETCEIKNNNISDNKVVNQDGLGKVYILEQEKFISKAKLDLGGEQKLDILWKTKDKEINIPDGIDSLSSSELGTSIDDIPEGVCDKAIICSESGRPYRILRQELEFYKNMNIPLPTKHPDTRYYERLSLKPKRQMCLRKCDRCEVEIISTFNKDNKNKIFCEECYNEAIY